MQARQYLPLFMLAACVAGPAPAQILNRQVTATVPNTIPTELPGGTLLRVQLDHTAKLKIGVPVSGHLLDSIYLMDRQVIPAGTLITGHVVGTRPVPAKDRIWELLQADVTPYKTPLLVFDQISTPSGPVALNAPASERTASLVHMQSSAKHGRLAIVSQLKTQARERFETARDTYTAPGKKDRIEQFIFKQLPYHPQRIWRTTQFDAELHQPLNVQDFDLDKTPAPAVCANVPEDQLPASTLHARLLTGITSKTARAGEVVDATLAQPVYKANTTQLLLPEGAHLSGTVIRARPARMFGRPGVLRFSLKQVSVAPQETCAAQSHARELALTGQLTGVESAPGANITLNSEGEAQAGPAPNRLLAPLTLAVLLARTYGDDGNNAGTGAVSGGGFGLAGRIVSLATRDANVTSGFAYFALGKSVIRRFIVRGHEVEFPRNTRFDIEVTPRAGADKPMR